MNTSTFIKLLTSLAFIFSGATGFSQPNIPQDKIPQDISADVGKELEGLYADDPISRANAAIALREFHSNALKPAMPFLIGMLGDNAELQIMGPYNPLAGIPTSPGEEAAKTLGKLGEDAIPPLSVALLDSNRHIRKCAAIGLGETGQPGAVDPLLSLITKEPYSDVMAAAIHSLGQIPSPKVVEPILAALQDKDWEIRREASYACKNIDDIRTVQPLLKILKEARRENELSVVMNIESTLENITKIYGSDKDEEWEAWWNTNKPETK